MNKKNDINFKFECERNLRQHIAFSTSSQHKKKSIKQIVKINEKFSEKQKYHIDHRKIYAGETLNQRKHIAEFFILFDIIFVL